MSYVEAEFERIASAADSSNRPAIDASPIAMWAISQTARGTFSVRRRATSESERWGQESIATQYSVALEFLANADCQTVMNGEIGGPLVGSLTTVSADGVATERGAHQGTFRWGRDGADALVVEGSFNGVSNAGTHRRPLYDAVTFDQAGQFTGRLEGAFEHPVLGKCILVASYVFDLADPDDDETSDVTGIVEGTVLTAG